jgi:branched-chain amino acid transport system substrate-binding protein
MKNFLVVTAVASAALIAAHLAVAQTPYNLNVMEPLTGSGAFLGQGQKAALESLAKSVNHDGGIHGRPVNFIFHDDQTNPQTAVQLLNQVLTTNPPVVLGSSLVAMCNAMAPILRNGPLLYCLSPGHSPVPGTYDIASGAPVDDTVQSLFRFFRLKGWTRLALITSSDASGQEADRAIGAVLALPENKSLNLIEHVHFNPTDISVTAQVERVKDAQPQAFVAWTTGTPIATVFRAIEQTGLDVPVGTTAGNFVYSQMKQFAAFVPKELYLAGSAFTPHDGVYKLDPRVEAVQHKFYAIMDAAGIVPDNMASTSWDAGAIVIDALKKLGPDATAEQLKNYILSLTDYPGINGLYDFKANPTHGLGAAGTVVLRWDGPRQRFVWASAPGGALLTH